MSQGRSRVAPEILAGLAGAIGSLPLSIAHGTIAFAPLGPAGVVAGAAASVLAAAIGGMLFGLLAGSRPLIGGPSAAVSLTIAGVVSAAVASGALPSGAEGIGAAVVISATLTLLAGGLVGSLSLLRLGRAATLIPYPVLSGFLNGTAALLVLTQFAPLLGQPIGTEPNLAEARPLAALVAGAALAAASDGDDEETRKAGPEYLRDRMFGIGPYMHMRLPFGDADNPTYIHIIFQILKLKFQIHT